MKFTKRNLRNITGIFEEKNRRGPEPRPPGKAPAPDAEAGTGGGGDRLLPGCARELFSPLHGDELSLGGTYEGNGIVSIQVGNDSDKDYYRDKETLGSQFITICRNKQQREGRCPSRETVENSIPYDGRLPCCSTC